MTYHNVYTALLNATVEPERPRKSERLQRTMSWLPIRTSTRRTAVSSQNLPSQNLNIRATCLDGIYCILEGHLTVSRRHHV
jgi:hypothetical protein